jgi:transcriptional regulator with XRE-family HTH domain
MVRKKDGPGVVELLRQAVRGSGKSLSQLSRDAGLSISQLSHFMRGTRTLTLPAVEKLCRALHLTLVEEEPPPRPARKARDEG